MVAEGSAFLSPYFMTHPKVYGDYIMKCTPTQLGFIASLLIGKN